MIFVNLTIHSIKLYKNNEKQLRMELKLYYRFLRLVIRYS